MTRTGKIARLPLHLREDTNRRLLDNEIGASILDWLNSLPEVQAVLGAEFAGRPITPANLTEWKNGGYREWLVRQEALDLAQSLQDQNALGHQSLTGPFGAKLTQWVTLHYAAAAQSLVTNDTDLQNQWRRLRELCADVSRLRRIELNAERLAVEREWLALEQSNSSRNREDEFWEWTERPEIHEQLYPEQERGISEETFQMFERYLFDGIVPPLIKTNPALRGDRSRRRKETVPRHFNPCPEANSVATPGRDAALRRPPVSTLGRDADVDQTPSKSDSVVESPTSPPESANSILQASPPESDPPVPSPSSDTVPVAEELESQAVASVPGESSEPISVTDLAPPSVRTSDFSPPPSLSVPAPEQCHECGSPLPPLLPTGARPLPACGVCSVRLHPPGTQYERCHICNAAIPLLPNGRHSMLRCPKCDHELLPPGIRVVRTCPDCGAALPPLTLEGARISNRCQECNAMLPFYEKC